MFVAEYLRCLKEWEDIYCSAEKALKSIVHYVQGLQQLETERPSAVIEMLKKVPTEELQRYNERGCRKKMDLRGWHFASEAQNEFRLLKDSLQRCTALLDEMDALVSTELSTQHRFASETSMSASSREVLSYGDVLFLATAKTDELKRERLLLETMVQDIGEFSNVTVLQTYLKVWTLRPYATKHSAQIFLRLAAI